MARRETRKRRSVKTPSGYTIPARRADDLRRAIANYNKRLARALATAEPGTLGAFPERVSFKDTVQRISTGRDITSYIKRLERYRQATGGFELTELGGRLVTKAQAEEYKRAAEAETRRRRKQLKMLQQAQQEQGRFRTGRLQELEPVTAEQIIKMSPERQEAFVRPLFEQEYIDPRLIRWQQNYIQSVEATIQLAAVTGVLDEDSAEAAQEIINIVSNLNPRIFRQAQLENPELEIPVAYDPVEFSMNVHAILAIWRRYG